MIAKASAWLSVEDCTIDESDVTDVTPTTAAEDTESALLPWTEDANPALSLSTMEAEEPPVADVTKGPLSESANCAASI